MRKFLGPYELSEEEERVLKDALSLLARRSSTSPWQPIETAPKDGTHILIVPIGDLIEVGVGGNRKLPSVCEAFWQDGWYCDRTVSGWQLANCDEEYGCLTNASYWMPLPEPPK